VKKPLCRLAEIPLPIEKDFIGIADFNISLNNLLIETFDLMGSRAFMFFEVSFEGCYHF